MPNPADLASNMQVGIPLKFFCAAQDLLDTFLRLYGLFTATIDDRY